MKFTEDSLKQLIAEEIQNFLNEQDDDHLYDREKLLTHLARLEAYIEDLEKKLSDEGIDTSGVTIGPGGTQIVDRLADTPIGEKPKGGQTTQIIRKK